MSDRTTNSSRVIADAACTACGCACDDIELHVDGNHSYESARADVDAWADLVIAGGWIIIDDYIWPYGDGPQRVGDEFLRSHQGEIACAFVMGSALFIQRAP